VISYSKPAYMAKLKAIWRESFGDSEKYLDLFFDRVYQDENTLVYLENARVVSALYMLPYHIRTVEGDSEIVYLYALATEKAYRGRGIMSQLIKKSHLVSRERNYALSVLIPANDDLFAYYGQFGYVACFDQVKITRKYEEIRKSSSGQKRLQFVKANSCQIWEAYLHSSFYSPGSVVLTEAQSAFYLEVLTLEGGEAWIYKNQCGVYGYVLVGLIGDDLFLYESSVEVGEFGALCGFLLENYVFKTITFYQPICFLEKERNRYTRPLAMAYKFQNISLKGIYFNRVLI
jgi:predicted N-acetyltransferase YhbS